MLGSIHRVDIYGRLCRPQRWRGKAAVGNHAGRVLGLVQGVCCL